MNFRLFIVVGILLFVVFAFIEYFYRSSICPDEEDDYDDLGYLSELGGGETE